MFCRIVKSLNGMKIVTKQPNSYKSSHRNYQDWPISDVVAHIFATDPYFATFIELLPEQGMLPEKYLSTNNMRIRRTKFTTAEDNLLALGVQQFKGVGKFDSISEHLLPTKFPRQLKIRTKNLCSSQQKFNPMKVLRKEGFLPWLESKVAILIPRGI